MLAEFFDFSVAVVASDSEWFVLCFDESALDGFSCVGDTGWIAAVDDADEFFGQLYFCFFHHVIVSYDVDGCFG